MPSSSFLKPLYILLMCLALLLSLLAAVSLTLGLFDLMSPERASVGVLIGGLLAVLSAAGAYEISKEICADERESADE